MVRRPLALLVAVAVFAPPAIAATPEPLVDVAPSSSLAGRTTVLNADAPASVRAVRDTTRTYAAGDARVSVTMSAAYGDNASVAQTYATFLGSLLHGDELGELRVVVATPDEVVAECGGADGTLACYDPTSETMVVPGEQPDDAEGVTVSYIVAHEYGHHVAANRTSRPFSALDYGPKYWASEQLVCLGTLQGLLAPGDEGFAYSSNPGEAWAETYAMLKYPTGREWAYTDRLTPTDAALKAARRDVVDPWERQKERRYHGRLGATSRRSFRFKLRLDGQLSLRLLGPSGTNFDLAVASDGVDQGSTDDAGSRDVLSYDVACRERSTETVTATVRRVRGRGRFTLIARYAG